MLKVVNFPPNNTTPMLFIKYPKGIPAVAMETPHLTARIT